MAVTESRYQSNAKPHSFGPVDSVSAQTASNNGDRLSKETLSKSPLRIREVVSVPLAWSSDSKRSWPQERQFADPLPRAVRLPCPYSPAADLKVAERLGGRTAREHKIGPRARHLPARGRGLTFRCDVIDVCIQCRHSRSIR